MSSENKTQRKKVDISHNDNNWTQGTMRRKDNYKHVLMFTILCFTGLPGTWGCGSQLSRSHLVTVTLVIMA